MHHFPPDPIFTNAGLYREIATEALRVSQDEMERRPQPRDDGSQGYIKTFDPHSTSFKQSMVAIVFAGMFMEAWLWLTGSRVIGTEKYEPIDSLPLEQRLQALGVDDAQLRADLKAYREVRREIVHEKAVPFSKDKSPTRVAQSEANKAVELMLRLERTLKDKFDLARSYS